jgi:cell division ATPase FtsA
MAEKDWIDEAVNEFRKGCQKLQDELAHAANGTLLDVSDEQIMKNIEPLLKKVQQKAIQKVMEKAQVDPDYRRCGKCKKK